jgi:lysozyme
MTPSPACEALVKQFEGCHKRLSDGRYIAYPDPGTGDVPWTIGWGSTGPDVRKGTIWTQTQCDLRLRTDLAKFARGVWDRLPNTPTSQSQFDAMVSFAYNVGLGKFSGSTLLRKHRAKDYAGAAREFERWNKAGGRVLPGLTRRRAAEAELYRSEP